MVLWLPDARRNLGQHAGDFVGPVTIGVIHTTESSSFTPGDTYFGRNVWPHFTFIPGDHPYTNAVWQHLPLNKAARALANRSGGVETNREGCIQIEVVAYASRPRWSQGGSQTVFNFRRLMAEIEEATDIPHRCGVTFGGNEQYGLDNRYELSNAEWEAYRGWLGHQHVPENSHWDPGEIDIANLLLKDADHVEDDEMMKHGDRALHVRAAKQTLRAVLKEWRDTNGLSLDQDRDLPNLSWTYDDDTAQLVRYLLVRVLGVDEGNTDGRELHACQLTELARRTERTRQRVPAT